MGSKDHQKIVEDILHIDEGLPHATNLLRKIILANTNQGFKKALDKIVPAYYDMNKKITATDDLEKMVAALNKYLEIIRSEECKIFSHQSDFLSSVVPEFLYLIFLQIIKKNKLAYQVKSQEDVIIDCNFDPQIENSISFEKKRVDVLLIKTAKFVFNDVEYSDFFIPVIAIEVKTNMDKNMISGIENSVESLKRTFPRSLYFAVCEWADFAFEKQNYANTYIDEIFVLRKQRRSDFRVSGIVNKIDTQVVKHFIDRVEEHLTSLQNQTQSI